MLRKTNRLVHYDVRIRWSYGNELLQINGFCSMKLGLDACVRGKYIQESLEQLSEDHILDNLPKWTKGDKTTFIAFDKKLLTLDVKNIKLV